MKILNSFKDPTGNYDGKRISAFILFIWIMISAFADQFTAYEASEFVFGTLVATFLTLLGLSVPEILAKIRMDKEQEEASEEAI